MSIQTLRTRFVGAGFLLLAAIIGCGLWSIVSIVRLGSTLGDTLDDHQQTIDVAVDMILTLEREDDALLLALQGNTKIAVEQLAHQRAHFEAAFVKLAATPATDADHEALRKLRVDVDDFRRICDVLMAAIGRDNAFDLYYEMVSPALRTAVASCRYFREANVEAMQEEGIEARRDARQSSLIVGVVTFAAVVVAAGVLTRLTRSVMVPIGELDRAVDAIRHDDLEHRVAVRAADELGRLASGFNRMAERLMDHRRETEERFHQLAENISEIYWVMDPNGKVLYISPGYEDVWGRSRESLYLAPPGSWVATLHPDDRDEQIRNYEDNLRGTSSSTEFRILRPDGAQRWVRNRAFPVQDETGRVSRIAGLCEEITQRKQLESELRHAKDSAEAASQAKDEFLANVSHEIRTPMNAILGLTELVLDSEVNDDQRQCLGTVKSAADHLLGIINDLLDFSKIEAGKLELAPIPFSLRALVRDLLRGPALRAHQQGVELVSTIDERLPDALVGDAGRLRQVLLNLVGNAVKFTAAGEVAVNVELVESSLGPSSEQGILARFVVRDTGIGIPADMHERIFLPFEQQDTSTTRKYGGTGLGLSIAAQLVALMGGSIALESKPGEGSTFTFTVRLEKHAAATDAEHPDQFGADVQRHAPIDSKELFTAMRRGVEKPIASAANGSGSRALRILIAEDSEFNSQMIERLLARRGHHVHLVADGETALACATEQAFNILLLDIHMPRRDGFQVIQALREHERSTNRHLPVVALTARSRAEDRERCLAAGMDAFLSKPVQAAELFATIERLTSTKESTTGDAVGEPDARLLDATILLGACGGDDEVLRRLTQMFLETLPDRLEWMRSALTAGDASALREAAHKLCGMIATFSSVAGATASSLEDHAESGRLDGCAPLIVRLTDIGAQLERELAGVTVATLQAVSG